MRDTLPFLVFNSLERKDDPCKSDSQTLYPFWKNAWHFTAVKVMAQHFTLFEKMRDILPFLVFNSHCRGGAGKHGALKVVLQYCIEVT